MSKRKTIAELEAELAAANAQLAFEREQRLAADLSEVTERRAMERALRESEARYRAAITAAKAVPYSLDYRTDGFTFMGEGILALTGYTPEEMTHEFYRSRIQDALMYDEFAGLALMEAVELV